MATIAETLRRATEVLQARGIAEPRREAGSLLAFALNRDKSFLFAHPEYLLAADEKARFESFLERRARHEPFQYITGHQEFYGLDFRVTPDVLIPRPETELIVESAVEILRDRENPVFCEVGVGSGCITVAVLHEVRSASAVGLDISPAALEIAAGNARRNRVADRLELKISNVFAILADERFDLIVSNPPYVPREDVDTLQAEVRDFEPVIALTDGKNGFSIIEEIIGKSPRFLQPGGFLLMEIGFNQSGRVGEMFAPDLWREVDILPDLQGIPRMVRAQLNLIETSG